MIALLSQPRSLFTEEIKKLRANLKFSQVNDDVKVIMVTSSIPGEGKSTISSNLAAAFAQDGQKVLIIDCDLRKGRQNDIFEVVNKQSNGLSLLLLEKDLEKELNTYVYKTEIDNLELIPTGLYPPNPSELLSSKKFKKLVEIARKEYDLVILDCPPVTGLNDALVVSSLADTTIVVARANKTPVELLSNTKKALEGVKANIGGVVLNQINTKGNSYYYSNEYYYSNDESKHQKKETKKKTSNK